MILAILFRGEKVAVLPGSNRFSGGALLNDKVEGGNKGLEIPVPLVQVGITKPVQSEIGVALQEVGQRHSPGKLVRI